MLNFNYVCGILVREPYFLSLEQIRKLTPYQVQQIYAKDPKTQSPYVGGPSRAPGVGGSSSLTPDVLRKLGIPMKEDPSQANVPPPCFPLSPLTKPSK